MTITNPITLTATTGLLLLSLAPAQTWAIDGDSDKPIAVEADSLEVRDEDNISIYQGNVSLKQGSLELDSDRLVIHFSDERDLELMEMNGTPARFRQLDNEREEMLGEARQINYTESETLLELIGDAHFIHAGDLIESELIRINTDTNAIQAGDPDSDERVKMLIQPRQNGGRVESPGSEPPEGVSQ